MKSEQVKEGLRVVAIFEGTKGLLVVLTGFGLLMYIHGDLHTRAEELVRLFHLNPASRYPRIFIDLANHVTDTQLWLLAASGMLYAIVRFIEAIGLWFQRVWAEWFALLTGGIYVPLELYELLRRATWPRVTLLVVNAAIVAYLSIVLYSKQKRQHGQKQK